MLTEGNDTQPGSLTTSLSIAFTRTEIEGFLFNDQRVAWASSVIKARDPLAGLQEIDRCKIIEMVQRDVHLAPSHLTEDAKHFNAIFGSRVPNLSHRKNLKAGGN